MRLADGDALKKNANGVEAIEDRGHRIASLVPWGRDFVAWLDRAVSKGILSGTKGVVGLVAAEIFRKDSLCLRNLLMPVRCRLVIWKRSISFSFSQDRFPWIQKIQGIFCGVSSLANHSRAGLMRKNCRGYSDEGMKFSAMTTVDSSLVAGIESFSSIQSISARSSVVSRA